MAQSTGTEAIEEIIVTGSYQRHGISGFDIPDTSKARAALTNEQLMRQTPGQTVLDSINMLPGVSFQNNDGYGASGGKLNIRGFDNSRISLTWDGMPVNDSGNYAIYSSQLLDPELIDRVTVNLGTTDIDSPTASAAGGTVAYLTRLPMEQMGALMSASIGKYDYHRIFAVIDTGAIGPLGTRAFISGSLSNNENPFNDYGVVDRKQVNARIYQPIGSDGDFISIAGHYNEARNNFFGSVGLRNDRPVTAGFPQNKDDRFYSVPRCETTDPVAGVADKANSCGSTFDERWNPSNTGNVRVQSRFTLTDGLILTVDPSFQYVRANGGGTVVANEGFYTGGGVGGPITGYIGGAPWAGRDLNGDGDMLDTVRMLAPSNTNTRRWVVNASLVYTINDMHRVRIAYTFDRAKHRQTGEIGFLDVSGRPYDVFGLSDPVTDGTGHILQKRDRLSYATLNQVAGEYVGRFLDERLVVNLGLRAPFFKRDLNQNCFTTNASGAVSCFDGNEAAEGAFGAANPKAVGPTSVVYNYNRVLPNAGFNLNIVGDLNLFGNYSKGLSVPGTDNLYNSLWFRGADGTKPQPETTDTFDTGLRWRSSQVVAQLAGWYTKFTNRLASSYDPVINETIYRNLGDVKKWGVDASVAYQPIEQITAYAMGSYKKSKIHDDVQTGIDASGNPIYAATAGKEESGSPDWMFGGRLEGRLGPLELGIQAKYTGGRYIYDTNTPVMVAGAQVFPAKTPDYTLVDIDVRFSLEQIGFKRSYLQFNVTNLLDEMYVGGYDGGLPASNPPFVQIGAPRTISGTIVIGF